MGLALYMSVEERSRGGTDNRERLASLLLAAGKMSRATTRYNVERRPRGRAKTPVSNFT